MHCGEGLKDSKGSFAIPYREQGMKKSPRKQGLGKNIVFFLAKRMCVTLESAQLKNEVS